MNLQAEKIELAKLLLSTENTELVQSVRNLFKEEKVFDFWDELTLDQKDEIKVATQQIEQGLTTDYETFMAKHR